MKQKTLEKIVKRYMKNNSLTGAERELFEDFLTNPNITNKMFDIVRNVIKCIDRDGR